MNQDSTSAWFFRSCLALFIMFLGPSFRGQARSHEQDASFSRELAKKLQQEAATAELQVTLAGDLKDFSVATGGIGSQTTLGTQQNQVRAAVAAFRESLKNDPGNAELHFDLSLALSKLGDATAAQEELETAVRLDRHLAKARNQLGIWHLLNKENAKAEGAFKSAITSDAQFVEAKNNLGVFYALSGKDLEALELFHQAILQRPDYSSAHVNLGLVLASEGKNAEAEKEIRSALRNSPKYLNAYNALGMIAAKLGRGDEAIEILQEVAQIQPGSASAHLNLGMALSGGGFDLSGALNQRSAELLDHLVTLEPSNSDAKLLLGRNLLILGQTDEAIHHLQLSVGASPNNEDALYALAQALSRAGSPDAKVFLERFQNLKQQREVNDRIQKLGSYGLESANAKDWPQAVKNFKEALELCGLCASAEDLHRNLGLILVLKGEIEVGRQELEKALRLKPDDADARRALESLPKKEPPPD